MSGSRLRNDREPLNQIADPPASEATVRGDAASADEPFASGRAHDELARRAYQLFEERGREPGRDWEDWFRAEREL